MKPDDVTVLESLLRGMAAKLHSLTRDTEFALEVLAARNRQSQWTASPHPLTKDLLDESRFVVRWNGAKCHLGLTIPYRLFRRLAASPNQYVCYEQLLDDVWGGPRSASAIRTAVSELRRKLIDSGMEDLARAIDGKNPGHYCLCMDRNSKPRGTDRERTQTGR